MAAADTIVGQITKAMDVKTTDHVHVATRSTPAVNVHDTERMVSAVLGGLLIVGGLKRGSVGGAALAMAGGGLLYRGVSGHCSLYAELGVNTAQPAAPSEPGVGAHAAEVERTITIGKPAAELYELWRQPGTVAQIMGHFAHVTAIGDDRAHWSVQVPLGQHVEWDADVVEERPGELIRWASAAGAALPNEGSVRFQAAPLDWGTEVVLTMRFEPPGGALGEWAAKLLGAVPKALALTALHRFKSLAETGEVPTITRQPAARNGGRDA